jgi:soluble lytic murein transglycosylase-like protein
VRYAPVAALLVLSGCAPHAADGPGDSPRGLAERRQIWEAIQPMAAMRGIDPLFVYAIVALESNFDPHARRGEARGLMQIKPQAWRAVSDIPYDTGVWDWRTNLAVGIDRLASTKRALAAKGVFSYPLLFAAYHHGMDYVAARGFDMSRIPRPRGPISRRLWSGEIHPVNPPN